MKKAPAKYKICSAASRVVVGVIIWHLDNLFGMRAVRNAHKRPICTREHMRELEHGHVNHSDDPEGSFDPQHCGALVPIRPRGCCVISGKATRR